MKILLASSSPRRQELIRRIGVTNAKVIAPKGVETLETDMPPEDAVAVLSRRKAEEVASLYASPEDVVIAADTVVWYDGNILGKPVDEADAFNMLTMLSGNWHVVYTGVTIIRGDELITEEESTSVLIRNLTAAQIESYIATGEPLDKAGAYGIQERGALLCERVDGDFYNVMGLPLFRLGHMLERLGVDLLSGT